MGCEQFKNTDYSPAAVECRKKAAEGELTTDEAIKLQQDELSELGTFINQEGETVNDINLKIKNLENQLDLDASGNPKNSPLNKMLMNELTFVTGQYNRRSTHLNKLYESKIPPTVEDWNTETSELIRLNGGTDEDIDFTGQGTDSWETSQLLRNKSRKSDINTATLMNILNRPGGPSQQQFEYVHSKNKYLESKRGDLILEDPGGEPSDFVLSLYKDYAEANPGGFSNVSKIEVTRDGKKATDEEVENVEELKAEKPTLWDSVVGLLKPGTVAERMKRFTSSEVSRKIADDEISKFGVDLGNQYESQINFLQEERKKLSPFADHKKIAEIDQQIKRLQYSSQNVEREEFTKTSTQFNKVKSELKNSFSAERRQIDNNPNLSAKEKEEQHAILDERALMELPKGVQKEYKNNLDLIKQVTTAKYSDTWSSFGSFKDDGTRVEIDSRGIKKTSKEENVDRNGDGVIDEKDAYIDESEVYLPSDEVQAAILDIASNDSRLKNLSSYALKNDEDIVLSLEEKEQIISAAKHVVLENSYGNQTTEFEKANQILYKYGDLKNVPSEVVTAANKIRSNAINNIRNINAELGYNVSTNAFDDSFRMSGQFKHWRDKHIDGNLGGEISDSIGTLGQGLIQIGGEAIVGTGVTLANWASKGFMGAMKFLDVDLNYQAGEERLDYIDATWGKYGGFNFLGISDKDSSIYRDGFNFRTASKTITNMAPFTIGVALAARKGNISKVQKAWNMLPGMGHSKKTEAAFKMASFAYKATINDNRMEAKDLGLDDGAAAIYANGMSFATAVSQAIMPDIKFFNTTAGKNFSATFIQNLKKTATKEGRKAVITQFIENTVGEIVEEEAELFMQDMVKASLGLSNEMKFFDMETQVETISGTVLLTGSTSAITSPTLARNTRNQVYQQFRMDAVGTIDAMKEAEGDAQKQLDAAKKGGNQKAIDRAQLQLDQIKSAGDYASRLIRAINVAPDIMNNEAIELLVQKEALLDEKSKLRKNSPEVKNIDDAITAIDAQIEQGVVAENEQTIKERTDKNVKSLAKDLGVKFESVTVEQGVKGSKDLINELNRTRDSDSQIDPKQANDQGFIVKNPDGTKTIVVNEHVSGDITTSQHELFHAALAEIVKDTDQLSSIAKGLKGFLNAELAKMQQQGDLSSQLGAGYVNSRLAAYETDPDSIQDEELLTIVSEAMTQGYIKLEEGSVIDKLGDVVRRGLSSLGFKASFKSGKDVYNFIKDFNKGVEKGKFSKGMQRTFAEGADVDMQTDDEVTLSDESVFKKDAAREERVQLLFNEPGSNKSKKALKIAQSYKPLVQALVNQMDPNVFGSMDKRNAINDIIADGNNPGSVYNIIMNYDPNSGISLDETIGRTLMPQKESTVKSSKKGTEKSTEKSFVKAAQVDTVGDVAESVIKKLKDEEEETPAEYDIDRIETNLELNKDVGNVFVRENNRKDLEAELARAKEVQRMIDERSPDELRQELELAKDIGNVFSRKRVTDDIKYALKRQQEVRFPGNVGVTNPLTGNPIQKPATTPGSVKSSKVSAPQIVQNLSKKGLNVSEKQVDDMVGKITSRATAKFWSRMSATNQEIVPRKLYKDSAKNLLLGIANDYRKEISKNTGKQVTLSIHGQYWYAKIKQSC